MYVAERGIVKAACGQCLLIDGVKADLAVRTENVPRPLCALRADIRDVGAVGAAGERRAVNAHAQLRKLRTLDVSFGEDTHVLGDIQLCVRRARVVRVMISRRDEHRHAHIPQTAHKLRSGLEIRSAAVEDITGEQDDVCPLAARQLRQP